MNRKLTLGKKIYKLRKENGLSQEQMAEKLDVSRQAIFKWETGVNPDINNIIKLSEFFDCSTDYLLGKDDLKNNKEKLFSDTYNIKEHKNHKNPLKKFFTPIYIILISIFILGILWVFSIFTDYPITHQDIDSGNFYTGFGGFIDYYKLDGLVLLALIGIAIGLLIPTIDSLYLKQIFDNKNKKIKFIYN